MSDFIFEGPSGEELLAGDENSVRIGPKGMSAGDAIRREQAHTSQSGIPSVGSGLIVINLGDENSFSATQNVQLNSYTEHIFTITGENDEKATYIVFGVEGKAGSKIKFPQNSVMESGDPRWDFINKVLTIESGMMEIVISKMRKSDSNFVYIIKASQWLF